ncbi:hypothetical protein B9Z55_000915 [Caenorhabditis nigoni]|nr:hypothetical protein B9Z55_000915 [Caenorhabditis nigoni]
MGVYEFIRMPMGLKGSPGTFQRVIYSMLKPLKAKIFCYMDDLILTSRTPEEHIRDQNWSQSGQYLMRPTQMWQLYLGRVLAIANYNLNTKKTNLDFVWARRQEDQERREREELQRLLEQDRRLENQNNLELVPYKSEIVRRFRELIIPKDSPLRELPEFRGLGPSTSTLEIPKSNPEIRLSDKELKEFLKRCEQRTPPKPEFRSPDYQTPAEQFQAPITSNQAAKSTPKGRKVHFRARSTPRERSLFGNFLRVFGKKLGFETPRGAPASSSTEDSSTSTEPESTTPPKFEKKSKNESKQEAPEGSSTENEDHQRKSAKMSLADDLKWEGPTTEEPDAARALKYLAGMIPKFSEGNSAKLRNWIVEFRSALHRLKKLTTSS